jgi:hypothetical protein
MRTRNLLSALAAGAMVLMTAARADALGVISSPTSAYTSATSLISIGGLADGDEVGAISNGALTVGFSTTMMRLTVPDSWGTWNTPPFVESSTPPVLWSEGATGVLMSLSTPQLVFGFEAQPDLSDVETLIASFFDEHGNLLGEVVRDVSGNGGALLFAVTSDVPIGSVLFTDAAGEDFAIANVRYSSQFFVPVPGSGLLAATGLMLLLLRRSRR